MKTILTVALILANGASVNIETTQFATMQACLDEARAQMDIALPIALRSRDAINTIWQCDPVQKGMI